jgi:hypothetical protein
MNITKLNTTMSTLNTDLPENPDFSFIQKDFESILSKAYKFVSEEEGWKDMANYKEYSYIFINEKNKNIINLRNIIIKKCNISLVVCSKIMLQLEHLSNFGYTKYKDYYTREVIFNLRS